MSLIDFAIGQFDNALRTLTGQRKAAVPSPAEGVEESELDAAQRSHVAGLLRVNHTGEVCAQALYEGQAVTARDAATRTLLLNSADEEANHLAWCEARLTELDAKPSVFNPLFYAASYGLGMATGLLGDRISLGFVEATEDQVCEHLKDHLEALPEQDARSRAILATMQDDEAAHGQRALDAGGSEFPEPFKQLMRLTSRVMTTTTYRH